MAEIQWNSRDAVYEFRTAAVRGTLVPGGPRMGVQSLVAQRSGRDWVQGPGAPEGGRDVATAQTRLLGLGRCLADGHACVDVADLAYEHWLAGSSVFSVLTMPEGLPVALTCRWEVADPARLDLMVAVEASQPVPSFVVECVCGCLLPKAARPPLVWLGEAGKAGMLALDQWLPSGGAGTIRSFAHGAWGGDAVEPADAVGYPLLLVPDQEQAYLGMGHPFDVRHMGVWTREMDGAHHLSHTFQLLGHDLHKGVQFQARVRVCVVDWSDPGEECPVEVAQFFGRDLL